MARRKNGKITETVSVGTRESVGEGSQENPNLKKEMLPPKDVPEKYSKVILSYGMTKSIGDFEFIRIDIGAEDFCARDKKQETWDELHKEVSLRIEKILKDTESIRNEASISKPKTGVELKEIDPAFLEKKKTLNRMILNAAKFGKIRYQVAVDKLKSIELNSDLCDKLINDLNEKSYDFFIEKGEVGDDGEGNAGTGSSGNGSVAVEEGGEVSFEAYIES